MSQAKTTMKHVAFICANETSPWGGSDLLWSMTAERLVTGGVRVSIGRRAWPNDAPQIAQLQKFGCRVVHRNPEILVKRMARKLLPMRDADLRFVSAVADASTDLVVISQGNSNDGLRWMQACAALGLRYAIITQAAAEQFWPADDVAEQLAKYFEKATAVYFVSEANMKICRRQLATAIPRAKVVRNPFGVSYQATPPWPGDSLQHLSLACVGRLDLVAKGQDLLVDVLALPTWRERAVSLTLYGSGSNGRCIEHQIAEAGLTNVHFGGHIDRIEQVWAKHHAMVLPSRFEGLPIALVEAMLCGRACIATNVAGNAEVITDSVNGFLAAAPTVALLADAMERAWQARGELQAMGQHGARDIRQLVPADVIAPFVAELQQAANVSVA